MRAAVERCLLEPRDLASMGESTLRLWASQVGIAANKSDPDETGWDFLLELPWPLDQSETIALPLDRVPRPVQSFVQVKSSDGRPERWPVKLSNWVRLIESPLPAFFLVLEFDGEQTCQRAYLVHVGDKYITRVLKRLRELSSESEPDLRKRTLQFRYDECHKLSSADGEGLLRAIRSHVDSLEAYADWKSEVLRRVGYEDGQWQISVVVPPPASGVGVQEHLVDFTLGLIPSVEATRIDVRDVRFGIVAQQPDMSFTQGPMIEMVNRKPVGKGTVLLTKPDGTKQLRLDMEIYVPQGIGFELERQHFKVRFAAPFVDFIFWPFQPGRADFRYELPDPRERRPLMQLQLVSELVLLLHEAITSNGRIGVDVKIDSRPFYTGYLDARGSFSRQIVDYVSAIARAWTIAKYFDVHHVVQVEPRDLLHQEERLMFMASVVGPTRPPARVTYWSGDPVASYDKAVCVPYVTDAVIGQYRMAIAAAFIGQAQATGKTRYEEDDQLREFIIETDDLRLCRQYLCGGDEVPQLTFRDLAQSVTEEYEGSHHILIAEGINDHLLESQR